MKKLLFFIGVLFLWSGVLAAQEPTTFNYFLVGNFNNWKVETALPMEGDTITIPDAGGLYTFKVITPQIISGEDPEWNSALGYDMVDPEASSENYEKGENNAIKCFILDTCDLKVSVMQGYVSVKGSFVQASEIVKVGEKGVATHYSKYDLAIPENVTVYACEGSSGKLIPVQIEDVIPAETPVVIKAEEGDYEFKLAEEKPSKTYNSALTGFLEATSIESLGTVIVYGVWPNGELVPWGFEFHKCSSEVTEIPAQKAVYIKQE